MLKTSLDMAVIALRVNLRLKFPQIDFEYALLAKSSQLLWRNYQFPFISFACSFFCSFIFFCQTFKPTSQFDGVKISISGDFYHCLSAFHFSRVISQLQNLFQNQLIQNLIFIRIFSIELNGPSMIHTHLLIISHCTLLCVFFSLFCDCFALIFSSF